MWRLSRETAQKNRVFQKRDMGGKREEKKAWDTCGLVGLLFRWKIIAMIGLLREQKEEDLGTVKEV